MTTPAAADAHYEDLLRKAEVLFPGVDIGRPGRSRGFKPTIAAVRALRARFDVTTEGLDQVPKGSAILIGNHSHFLDPVVVVMNAWWQVAAFTKVEWFEHRYSFFFRLMGQIPLRRGDEEATAWAMEMSQAILAGGGKVAIYPEGTRSPDSEVLHRFHKRILIPLLRANPDVPVHLVFTEFGPKRGVRRRKVLVRASGRVALDARNMTPEEMVAVLRDGLIELGGMRYEDRYARDVKAELRAAREQDGHGKDTA